MTEIDGRTKAVAGRLLNEVESKQMLAQAGISTTPARLARSRAEAMQLAAETGFPAVLKVISPEISHKSDAGGVALSLASGEAVGAAYDRMMTAVRAAQPAATIDGVSVQAMARPGTEVIIGMTRDAQFGPVLMFGLGGIFVEVFNDVVFRLVPVTERDADQMVHEIKGFPVLAGVRGSEPVDVMALRDLLISVSRFVETHPEIVELDLNPVFAYADGAVAVDARIVVSPN